MHKATSSWRLVPLYALMVVEQKEIASKHHHNELLSEKKSEEGNWAAGTTMRVECNSAVFVDKSFNTNKAHGAMLDLHTTIDVDLLL